MDLLLPRLTLWTLIDWRYPYHIDAEVLQVVQFLRDARNVAPTVTVTVQE
jgi:hypothetical protein